MVIVFIFLVFIAIKFISFRKSQVKIDLDSVTFFEGSLGSGKTRILTAMTMKYFKKKLFRYKLFKFLNNISFGLIKQYNYPYVFSNYPLYLGKKYGFSYVINTDVLNWEYKIPEDSIVVLDEVGYVFPNQKEKTDESYTFGITWLRHATNATILCASQSLSECNISFRRKVNRCYHLHNCSKFFGPLSTVEVIPVIISEDIKNIYSSSSSDTELKRYMFLNPKKNFNSRYGKLLYNLSNEQRFVVSKNFNSLLNILGYKNGDMWRCLHYDV